MMTVLIIQGDVVAKMQLVKTVASLLKARKLGKVHPEKQEEEVVEQPKALHTEDDENDEACTYLSILFFYVVKLHAGVHVRFNFLFA